MGEKVLTITVPSYNAEQFLDRGIPSMLDDSIMEDIEILIIDDGSTDRTAEIADDFEEKYKGTVRAIHKENGGHGSAVNSGILNASGKYFCVVDADDWVDTSNFSKLVKMLKTVNSDLVLSDAVKVDEEDKVIGNMKIKKLPPKREVELDNYIEKIKNIEMHNIVFKTSILKDNNIKLHEHYYYVDQEYVLFTLLHVNTVTYTNLVVYHYFVGRNGQSVSISSRRKNYAMYEKICDILVEFYKSNKSLMSKERRLFFQRKISLHIGGIYSTLMSYKTNDAKNLMIKYDNKLLSMEKDIYEANQYLSIEVLRYSKFLFYYLASVIYRTKNNIKN